VKEKFVELGIASFEDLQDACLDDEVLSALKHALPVMTFSKFRTAVQKTSALDSNKLIMSATVTREEDRKPSASATVSSSSTSTTTATAAGGGTVKGTSRTSTSSHASLTLTLDEIAAMVEKVKLEVVAAEDPTKKELLEAKLKKYAELTGVITVRTETLTRAKLEKDKLARRVEKTEERIKALAGSLLLLHLLSSPRTLTSSPSISSPRTLTSSPSHLLSLRNRK
jgi:hypothetical protein